MRQNIPLVLIAIVMLSAVILVLMDRWRRGTFVFGVAVLLGAILRLIFRDECCGLLAVRRKAFDVSFLTVMGITIMWLASSIDPLGTG